MSTVYATQRTVRPIQNTIQPMGWGLSLLFFGVPGVLMIAATYVVTPALAAIGMLSYYAEVFPGVVVFAFMLLAALVGYYLEGRPLTWNGLKERFRWRRMTGKLWLAVLGAFVLLGILQYLGTGLANWLIEKGLMPLPASMPALLDPRASAPLFELLDRGAGGLRGNWLAFIVAAATFFFNLTGEEFWWRGYILPRQEAAFGKRTWLVHAVLWNLLFHASQYWRVIFLLPADLLWVYLAWRTKNNTTLLILHGVQLFSFPAFILLAVLGAGM